MLFRPLASLLVMAGLAVAQTAAPAPTSSSTAASRPKVTFTTVYTGGREIAVTFDDGPSRVETPRLLEMLAKRNIRATFFVLGQRVRDNPAIARQIVEEGHEIANHSWDHANLKKLSQDAVRSQLQRTHDIVRKTTGVEMKAFRPPYGSFSEAQRQWAYKEFGYPTILWAVDPLDWKRPGSSVIAQRIVNGTEPGNIVLAHDIHKMTVDAMPAALDGLLAKGYRFVTVSELLAMEKPRPVPTPAPSAAPAASPSTVSTTVTPVPGIPRAEPVHPVR